MTVFILNDPEERMTRLLARVKEAKSLHFVLCVGSTKTSDLENISAAGANPQQRRQTPRLDAEALVQGHKENGGSLPVSPEGIVSPVVIANTCLNLLKTKITVVNCGTFEAPQVESLTAGERVADCLSTGKALPREHVQTLVDKGAELAKSLADSSDLLVIAECVPAGTTTALAILTGLGYEVGGCVSSSMQTSNENFRVKLAQDGLTNSGLHKLIACGDPITTMKQIGEPLSVVASVGDPMQPFAASLALNASRHMPVVLGGGSQMLAVYALMKALADKQEVNHHVDNTAVITTSWVAFDKQAKVQELSQKVNAPFACSMLDFRNSRHTGLQAYEDGHVKEGVGAGATIVLAHLLGGYSSDDLINAIDEAYNKMVLGSMQNASTIKP